MTTLKRTDIAIMVIGILAIIGAVVAAIVVQPKVFCKNIDFSIVHRTAYLSQQLAQVDFLNVWIYSLAMTQSEFNQAGATAASFYIASSPTNAPNFRSDWINRLERGLPSCAKQIFVKPSQGIEPIQRFIQNHDPARDVRIVYVELNTTDVTMLGQYEALISSKYIDVGSNKPTVACRGIGFLFYGPLLQNTECETDSAVVRQQLSDLSGHPSTVADIQLTTSYCP